MVRGGGLYKVASGLYSDKRDCSEIEILLAKYPRAVVTLQSAYSYYELSDSIPEAFHLATDRDATKINDNQVYRVSTKLDTARVCSHLAGAGVSRYFVAQ